MFLNILIFPREFSDVANIFLSMGAMTEMEMSNVEEGKQKT